jgi:hypothetical protein
LLYANAHTYSYWDSNCNSHSNSATTYTNSHSAPTDSYTNANSDSAPTDSYADPNDNPDTYASIRGRQL